MRRPIRKARPAYRTLSRTEDLAHTICAAVNDAGCACSYNAKPACSQMLWAAQRAAKCLGVSLEEAERTT